MLTKTQEDFMSSNCFFLNIFRDASFNGQQMTMKSHCGSMLSKSLKYSTVLLTDRVLLNKTHFRIPSAATNGGSYFLLITEKILYGPYNYRANVKVIFNLFTIIMDLKII